MELACGSEKDLDKTVCEHYGQWLRGIMKFGVVIFKEVEELDSVDSWEIVAMWSKYAQGPEHRLIVGKD